MEIHSAYMKKFIQSEEARVRREITAAIYMGFRSGGFRISVSHDSNNETEKTVTSVNAFLKAVFESEYDNGRCWVFAAKNGMESPLWVLLVLDNVEDIISDYAVSAGALLTKANERAEKYQ